ncbi:MAG: MFS transporter [Bacteroidota bacterium]
MNSRAFRYATIVALGGFVFGLDAAVISGTVKFITQEFGLSDLQVGTAVSAPGFGVLFALPVASYLSDRIGRKSMLQLIAAVYLLSALGSAFAASFEMLVAARFIGGLAFTSITLASMYIGEIAPPEARGKLVGMTQINIVVGLSAAYFVNYLLVGQAETLQLGNDVWRYMLGSEIIPALLWLVLLFTIPRSPRWLMLVGKEPEAEQVLHRLLPGERVAQAILEIKESLIVSGPQLSFADQFREFVSRHYRKVFWIGVVFAIFQQTTGINAILFYAPTVFEQLGGGEDAAFSQALYIGLVGLVFTILALLLIDRLGRRPMTIYGLLWAVLSLLLCAYGFHTATYELNEDALASLGEVPGIEKLAALQDVVYSSDIAFKSALEEQLGVTTARAHEGELFQAAANLPATLILVGILSFIAAFHFSVGPIMWIVFSEIFSTRIRSVAIPTVAMVTSIVSYLTQQFFPWQLANMGGRDIFLFYGLTTGVGLILLYFILPETKGKTIEQIEEELTRG